MNLLQQNDPEVWSAVAAEMERQQDGREMIASENYTSVAVMEAVAGKNLVGAPAVRAARAGRAGR